MKTITILCILIFAASTLSAQHLITIPITASNNDAEEDINGMDLDDNDLNIGFSGIFQWGAVRFENVQLPEDARVDSVFIQFTAHEPNKGTPTIFIEGEAADNAMPFDTAAGNIENRLRTSTRVAWNTQGPWNQFDRTADQRTPDLRAIFNEIVQRPGWQDGNALAFILFGEEFVYEKIEVVSFDQPVAARVPLLEIYYSICELGISLTRNDQHCPGVNDGSIELQITGMQPVSQIQWSNGATTEDIDSLAPGIYSVRVTSELCDLRDTAVVLQSSLPLSCLTDTLAQSFCAGDTSIVLACEAPKGYDYSWSRDGAFHSTTSSPVLFVSESGNYQVAFNGICELGISASVEINVFDLPVRPEISLQADTLRGPPGFASYEWHLNGFFHAGTQEQFFVAEDEGIYSLSVVDENGCRSELSEVIEVIFTAVEDLENDVVTLYPNPASDVLFIRSNELTGYLLEIHDASGRLFHHGKFGAGKVEINHLASGVYFLRLYGSQEAISRKFVISR